MLLRANLSRSSQAILANATRICEAKHGTLFLFADGDVSAWLPCITLLAPLRRGQRRPHSTQHLVRASVAW